MQSRSKNNDSKSAGKGQARPQFSWPELRKRIEFLEKEGVCYLPAGWGRKNPSLDKWEEFRTRLPAPWETAQWFQKDKATNIGVVCGGVSRGLVILCFNDQDGAREFFEEERWQQLPQATFVTKSMRGHHVWLRSDTPIKSQKVGKGKDESWLEIRSDGNFTIAPPSLHPDGVLYEAIGIEQIHKPKDLAGFIDKRLSELGLTARRTKEAPMEKAKAERPERSDEFNTLAIEKLLGSCAFMQYCRDNATTLSEPWWWSEVSVLSVFGEPGRQKIHEVSAPYHRYTEKETGQKIKEALKAGEKEIGPHTCAFIEKDLGFACPGDCLAKKEGVRSPAGLATRLARRRLHITIDGVTYLERLDLNRIICSIPQVKEDNPPVVKTLTSFLIGPRMRITLEGESERLDTVLKTGNAEYPCLFRREAWNSKRQLLAALPSVDLQYYGTDKDTQAILAMVTSKELPIRRGTTVLGRNGELWVLRDGVLSRDGWVENPELVYIPSEVEFDRRVHYPNVEDETGLIKQVVPLLIMLNEGKIIFPVLGWFFATPFVPEIRRRLRHFPLLVVWGTHGGGKSSLLSRLWQLFGVESELFHTATGCHRVYHFLN